MDSRVPSYLGDHQGRDRKLRNLKLGSAFHRITEYLSWKGPVGIIESNSLLLAGLPKTKPYD